MLAAFLKLKTKPGKRRKFVEFLEWEGQVIRESEPGTIRFDVFLDPSNEDCIYIYEAFTDEEAHEAHKAGEPWKRAHGPFGDECVEQGELLMQWTSSTWPRDE